MLYAPLQLNHWNQLGVSWDGNYVSVPKMKEGDRFKSIGFLEVFDSVEALEKEYPSVEYMKLDYKQVQKEKKEE